MYAFFGYDASRGLFGIKMPRWAREKTERHTDIDRPNPPQNLRELRVALTEEWRALPRERLRKLILSMRRRCMALVNSRGGHTKY